MKANKLPELNPMFQRISNATDGFINLCAEMGFTRDEAIKILNVYQKAKAVKLNIAMGRYDFKHGAFVDVEVMKRALEV